MISTSTSPVRVRRRSRLRLKARGKEETEPPTTLSVIPFQRLGHKPLELPVESPSIIKQRTLSLITNRCPLITNNLLKVSQISSQGTYLRTPAELSTFQSIFSSLLFSSLLFFSLLFSSLSRLVTSKYRLSNQYSSLPTTLTDLTSDSDRSTLVCYLCDGLTHDSFMPPAPGKPSRKRDKNQEERTARAGTIKTTF